MLPEVHLLFPSLLRADIIRELHFPNSQGFFPAKINYLLDFPDLLNL